MEMSKSFPGFQSRGELAIASRPRFPGSISPRPAPTTLAGNAAKITIDLKPDIGGRHVTVEKHFSYRHFCLYPHNGNLCRKSTAAVTQVLLAATRTRSSMGSSPARLLRTPAARRVDPAIAQAASEDRVSEDVAPGADGGHGLHKEKVKVDRRASSAAHTQGGVRLCRMKEARLSRTTSPPMTLTGARRVRRGNT
jgi:hypothetical protein